MPKLLLINFSKHDAEAVSNELGIEVKRGYIADSGTYTVNEIGVSKPVLHFYIPESFAEFQAVFINFEIPKGLDAEFKDKLNHDYEKNGRRFLADYWYGNRGYLTIFTGKDLVDLPTLGVPLEATPAQQTDKSARVGFNVPKNNPLRVSLKDQLKNIRMPASHYLAIEDKKVFRDYLEDGHLDIAFTTRSDEPIGVFIDGKKDLGDYGWEDAPQVFVLPTFKSLINITSTLTRTFSELSPDFLPLTDKDWMSGDTYYPPAVTDIKSKIEEVQNTALKEIEQLSEQKKVAIEENKPFLDILTKSGDELVLAVQSLLSDILGLTVVDADENQGKGNRKEDLLITLPDKTLVLAEVKGTKSEYPSPKYFGQATNHFIRKAKLGASRCILIINHDYETEPAQRKNAYKGEDQELLDSFESVSYLDTRVLNKICTAVVNGELSIDDAISIVTGEGRIEYPLN